MEVDFLLKFYDQLFEAQLKCLSFKEPLFEYSNVLVNVCKRIINVCNNSKTAMLTFCQYLLNNIFQSNDKVANNSQHPFLVKLKQQDNVQVALFTIRMFLLSYFCKLGEEQKKNQWKNGLDYYMKQANIQFMFNCHDSLATMLVDLINRIEDICNQLPFYEKLINILLKHDLDFTVEQIRLKISKAKQNWKQNINKNKIDFTPYLNKKQSQHSSDATSKVKNQRKNIKIAQPQQKVETDESLRKRISDFREDQKKRLSEHLQSNKKRTLYYERKFIKKNGISLNRSDEQQQILPQEQQKIPNQNPQRKNIKQPTVPFIIIPEVARIYHRTLLKRTSIKATKLQNQQTDIDDFIVPATPPRKNREKVIEIKYQQQKNNQLI